jgi:hypothetical protein
MRYACNVIAEDEGEEAGGPRTIKSAVAQDLNDPKPIIQLIGLYLCLCEATCSSVVIA